MAKVNGSRSRLEAEMEVQLIGIGTPSFLKEYRFHPTRRWRFDFAWPEVMIALEVEGGTWVNGAHTRGRHYESDCEKYSEASIEGWCVIRVTTDMVKDGRAINLIDKAFAQKLENSCA